MPGKTIAVLGYHKIGDYPPDGWYTWSYVPLDIFEEQLQFIRNSDWQVLSFQEFLSGCAEPAALPEKSLLISFDDGYQSNLKIALPVLRKYGYPAIMFVPTGFIGRYNAFDADIFYEPREPICTWEELAELEKVGISIQSHSVNHPHLSGISDEDLEAELLLSKQDLEKHLNKKIEAFSFPYGDNGPDPGKTEMILKKCGYTTAFLYGGGPFELGKMNPFQISRIPIGPDTEIDKELNKF